MEGPMTNQTEPPKPPKPARAPAGMGDVHDWGPSVDALAERRKRAEALGGDERVERQHNFGKLTVRERIDLLLDADTFVEYGELADHMDPGLGDRYLAADGVVTGIGEIDGGCGIIVRVCRH